MDFDYSPKTKELQAKLNQFMHDYIYPAEALVEKELLENTQNNLVLELLGSCRFIMNFFHFHTSSEL